MRLFLRRRPTVVTALGGLACALLVVLAGFAWERARFGATDEESFTRVEREVQRRFAGMADRLERAARLQSVSAGRALEAPGEDAPLRAVFEQAERLVKAEEPRSLAITVYGISGARTAPLAWAGRPSELPLQRVNGPAALFIAPGPLGFRLVLTHPIVGGTSRLGTVVGELVFSEQATVTQAVRERFVLETSIAVVSLRTRYEGAGDLARPFTFLVRAPGGEPLLEATLDPADLARARNGFRGAIFDAAVGTLALACLLLCGSLLDRRALARDRRTYLSAAAGIAAAVVAARWLLWLATPVRASRLFSPDVYASPELGPLFRHPADFLLTGLAALALVVVAADLMERWRLAARARRRQPFASAGAAAGFVAIQAAVGAALALSTVAYERFLANTFNHARLDLFFFSPHPWDTARVTMSCGLIAFHAAFVWLTAVALRFALARWRFGWHPAVRGLVVAACWGWPLAVVFARDRFGVPVVSALTICGVLIAGVLSAPGGLGRLRRASQALRLVVLFVALLLPSLLTYPSLVGYEQAARRRAVETAYGPEVLNQTDSLLSRLKAAQEEIDRRVLELEAFVSVDAPPPGASLSPDSAFFTWRDTALERFRLSSAVELYNAGGALVSRFALNLPEDASRQLWHEESCRWQTFVEISPLGAQERQLLHAGRNICSPDGAILGTIVIHLILDDSTLSFISSQNPYFELLRGTPARPREDVSGRDLNFAVYGWSRTPLYSSGRSLWPLDDAVFQRIYASRRPFWTRLQTEGTTYDVYIENDRRGIYALGYPTITLYGHATNLAGLTTLVAGLYVAMLLAAAVFRVLAHRRFRTGRALLREIRESFYRKVFLAFVAASIIPVLALAAISRAYIADRLRHDVEASAQRTTSIAKRVIEEYAVAQPGGPGAQATLSDDALVSLSRVIGQDVNVFDGPDLVATSERDLFASGLLPVRTPADVYRAVTLERRPAFITEEQAGTFRYLIAAAPVRAGSRDALLTVPLTSRQRENEQEVDELNRRIVLAALMFIIVGAAFGYPLAERIADPVNRLMRATLRIGRGDFDARVATTASDELRRLVQAFNLMADELQRQRKELERTHRLEAWAEMARQVAHEIKNPLTPIQLNAEHLRRVHADRGKPLDPVLENCVEAILSQVRLLRQIASEFSSFASSPIARVAPTDLGELVDEVLRPYVTGSGGQVRFEAAVDAGLPLLQIDRALIGRALTNVVDNALHAMPGGGTLALRAWQPSPGRVELTVRDTGVGMDEEALSRLFEPYFSTKAVGTGLGLAIARRNLQLHGGTISVASERGRGTEVHIVLPVAPPAA